MEEGAKEGADRHGHGGPPAYPIDTRLGHPGGGGPVGCRPRLPCIPLAALRSRQAPGAARLQVAGSMRSKGPWASPSRDRAS